MRSKHPPVLDVCCGSRGFWYNKQDNRALFVDIRRENIVQKNSIRKDGSKWNGWTIRVQPNIRADFGNLPFASNTFALVVFDPPHMRRIGNSSRIAKVYGKLSGNWHDLLRKGFAECFRVLRPNGTLIFKWCEYDVPLAEILALTDYRPLFGHKSGKQQKTHWIAFLKPSKIGR